MERGRGVGCSKTQALCIVLYHGVNLHLTRLGSVVSNGKCSIVLQHGQLHDIYGGAAVHCRVTYASKTPVAAASGDCDNSAFSIGGLFAHHMHEDSMHQSTATKSRTVPESMQDQGTSRPQSPEGLGPVSWALRPTQALTVRYDTLDQSCIALACGERADCLQLLATNSELFACMVDTLRHCPPFQSTYAYIA